MSTSGEQEDVAVLFNAQPHIDDVETGLSFNEMYQSDKYTFMLKHKHFDLSRGEVLFVEKVADGYDVTVKEKEQLHSNAKPCMWLFESFWIPFGYTEGKHGSDLIPQLPPGNHNLGLRWLNNGGTEHTDELEREQCVRLDFLKGNAITTLINFECDSGCESECLRTNCNRDEDLRHHWEHTHPHYRSDASSLT